MNIVAGQHMPEEPFPHAARVSEDAAFMMALYEIGNGQMLAKSGEDRWGTAVVLPGYATYAKRVNLTESAAREVLRRTRVSLPSYTWCLTRATSGDNYERVEETVWEAM